MGDGLLRYDLGEGVEAFSAMRDAQLPYPVVQAHQVHGIRIAHVTRPDTTREELEGYDALITSVPGVAIGARTADCIPILIYDPVKRVVAAVHSGWRGTVQGISAAVINEMAFSYGSRAEDLRAVIGPGIGPRSFQVGEEVAAAFRDAGFPMEGIWTFEGPKGEGMQGGHHIDLWEACRLTLVRSGIPDTSIQLAAVDTFVTPEFYSARREGISCGRIINAICMK